MKAILNFFKDQIKKLKGQDKPKPKMEEPAHNAFNEPLSFSLEDLEKSGLSVEPVSEEQVNNEFLIHASQLPVHLLPWLGTLKNGIYRVTFPPEIQAQIYRGTLGVTGGVVRTPAGQIRSHGVSVTRVLAHPLIIVYQVGVLVFGSYHLQKIGASLKNINKRLGKIHNFLLDKRSAQIRAQIQEFSHISKGIVEFSKLGNIEEVTKRLELIKEIRLMNLSNLLHLQKNLIDNAKELGLLDRSSWFGSKKEEQSLERSIKDYKRDLIDYTSSLYLDIISTKAEVFYSMYKSFDEIKSRINAQKSGMKLLSSQKDSFEQVLSEKTKKLISKGGMLDIFADADKLTKARKNIKSIWKEAKLLTEQFQQNGGYHIQSIEDSLKNKNKALFLQVSNNKSDKKQKLSKQSSSKIKPPDHPPHLDKAS